MSSTVGKDLISWQDFVTPIQQALIKGKTCRLYYLFVINNTGSTRYVQLFDKATALSPGDVPSMVIPLAANANYFLNIGEFGKCFVSGLTVASSSTASIYTAGGGTDLILNVGYL